MSEHDEVLLEAESAVQTLLGQLQSLRAETENYSASRDALESVRKGLEDLIHRTESLATASHDSVKAIREIGTPQLLAALQAIRESGQATSDAATSAASGSSVLQERLDEAKATIVDLHASLRTMIEGVQDAQTKDRAWAHGAQSSLRSRVSIAIVLAALACAIGAAALLVPILGK